MPQALSLPAALFGLLACQLAGEVLKSVFALPIPGPVLGMAILTAVIALRDRNKTDAQAARPGQLDRVADLLLKTMGLLFVPAGVGIMAQFQVLQSQWLPIVLGVVGSTLLSLLVTGWLMHRLSRGGGR